MTVLWPFYEVYALLLNLAGCHVFEDLSARCPGWLHSVPW